MAKAIVLAPAQTDSDWRSARALIEHYARSLEVDLSFQNFAEEIEHLSREYGPPRGALILARENDVSLGCVALRAHAGSTAEIKRLYVVPEGRGHGIGRMLIESIIAEARRLGYRRLLLDTLPSMQSAQRLYVELGFRPTAPYRFNPVPGTQYFELDLG